MHIEYFLVWFKYGTFVAPGGWQQVVLWSFPVLSTEWTNSYTMSLFTIIICIIYYRIFTIVWLFAARCFISGGFQVTFVYTPEVNFIFNTKAKYAHKK